MATIGVDSTCRLPVTDAGICSKKSQTENLLVDEDIQRITERRLSGRSFRVLHWSLERFEESNGFLGQYFYLNVIVETEGESQRLKFFAKTPPPKSSPQYEFLTRFDTFNKEISVYTEVIKRMGTGRGPKWSPMCYLGKMDTIIVLEDAGEEGYANPDKYIPLDEEHLVWVVRVLSTFHSRSLILDEKLRQTSGKTIQDVYGHLLREVLFAAQDGESQRAVTASIKGAWVVVDITENLKDHEKVLVKERIDRWAQTMFRLLDPSNEFRNVICHRDIWANNIMFKHDHTGKPIGCYIIDYQFLRYCPPAYDLIFVLYLTTTRATRERHYDCFLRIYYDVMRQELADEGLNIEKCLPWSVFLESCNRAREVALIYAVLNIQIMLLTSATVKKYFEGSADIVQNVIYSDGRSKLVSHECRIEPAYRSRMTEIVQEIWERLPDQPPNV